MSADGATLPARPKRYFYTPAELAIVRAIYPTQGPEACALQLPTRTLSSIYQQARRMGLHAPGVKRAGEPLRRYTHDVFTDEAIRKTYSAPKPHRGWLEELARSLRRPKWWVQRRALTLGLSNPCRKQPPWSDEELGLLADTAHLHPQVVQSRLKRAGFKRSLGAIRTMQRRQKIGLRDARLVAGLYSGRQVAGLLGTDGSTVARWCRMGLLKAKPRGTARETGDEWEIKAGDLRAFIGANTERINLHHVDRDWFIHLLIGASS